MSIQREKLMTLASGEMLYNDLRSRVDDKAPIVANNVTGNLIAITDGIAGSSVKKMTVSFSPRQEGTGDPSPTNIRPITGWDGVNINRTGKNLYDGQFPSLSSDMYYRYYYVGNSPVTGSSSVPLSAQGYGNIFLLPGKANDGASTGVNNITNGVSRTVNPIDGWVTVAYRYTYDADPSDYDVQIEVGTTATAYEPYSGTTISISWQTEAGEVYGGTLDALTGILTVNMARADMGSATWTVGTNGNIHWFKSSRILTGAKILSTNSFAAKIVSDRFKNIQAAKIYSGEAEDNTIAQESINAADSNLRVKATSYNDDTEAFKTAMSGVYVYYELATPLTYQLTPIQITLLTGVNTIGTFADNMEIAYPIDTKKYVDAGARDVQVNGISILNDGVADIPVADRDNYGVVKVSGGNRGIEMDNGFLQITYASSGYIKNGSDARKPIVPYTQHEAAFYGLAKAAGVDLANESVTLGQFPNSAKAAIANMLGFPQLYSPMELIIRYPVTENIRELTVNTDQYGEPFKLAIAQIVLIFGNDVVAGVNDYIRCNFSTPDGLWRGGPTMRTIATSKSWLMYNFFQFGGIGMILGKSTATGNTQTANLSTFQSNTISDAGAPISIPYITGVRFTSYDETTTPIIAGSQVVIYGCKVIE